MINPSTIAPDVELRDKLLLENIYVVTGPNTTAPVPVYGDWERPTNETPSDFIVVMNNGDVGGFGNRVSYAGGFLMLSLYCKLNDDGSVKKNRVAKILEQIEALFLVPVTNDYKDLITDNYVYKFAPDRFITPTTPNITSGYSVTTLNLTWHTVNNFNKK